MGSVASFEPSSDAQSTQFPWLWPAKDSSWSQRNFSPWYVQRRMATLGREAFGLGKAVMAERFGVNVIRVAVAIDAKSRVRM
jgi:hypothetical protein